METPKIVVFVVKRYAVRETENGGTQYARGEGVSPSVNVVSDPSILII